MSIQVSRNSVFRTFQLKSFVALVLSDRVAFGLFLSGGGSQASCLLKGCHLRSAHLVSMCMDDLVLFIGFQHLG